MAQVGQILATNPSILRRGQMALQLGLLKCRFIMRFGEKLNAGCKPVGENAVSPPGGFWLKLSDLLYTKVIDIST
jgi:hypothetical protein